MTLQELAAKVNGKIAINIPDAEINFVYTSDLLSDVMGHCADESALITIQNHLNTIAVCTLVGVKAIVICHDRPIPDDMAQAAEREEVAIVTTPMSHFEASVALAELPAARK
jgi:hypothetical protein